jgi:DNA polymerase V
MKLIKGEFKERLELQFAQAVKAGFPSPAEDYMGETLDFNRDLIRNPEATFYALVEGDSMMDVGICKGDIAVIDRSIEPQHGDVVVGAIDREFTVKFLDLSHKDEGWIELRPANKAFKPIRIDESSDFRVWGVVIYTIKKWK